MRTKLYLSALCLPLAFAACTNDEFENLANNTPIKGETVNVVLSAARPQLGADTKMTIDSENQFVWEAQEDLLGAALQSTGTSDVTAFPFKADESARVSTFTGTSALPVGSYLFTYPYVDVLDQKVMPLNLPEQTYDPADTKTAIQQAVGYMKMISPMVNLAGVAYADVEEYNLNLQFANLYTLVRVNISAANIPAGVEPTVTGVTLNTDGDGFVSKASADLTEIAKAGVLTVNKDGKLDQEKLAAAVAELEELIASGDIYDGKKKDGQGEDGSADASPVYGASVLKVKDGCKLSASAETSLYILAPKGEYTKLTLKVNTSEGEYTRNITLTTPLVLGNDIQPIRAELNFDQQNGNVVLPEDIDVASAEDWNNAVDFVLDHAVAYLNKKVNFNLTKDIAIDNLPNFNVAVKGSEKTLTLNKNFTISANNVKNFTDSEVTLGVGSGATLTIEDLGTGNTFPFASIKNLGTLEVNGDLTVAINNLGTMNINEDVKLSGGVTNGQAKTAQLAEVAGTINVLDGETKVVTTALTNTVGEVVVAEGATLNIGIASTNGAKGTIENNGEITNASSAAIENNGVIDNYGKLACPITNTNGQVIAEKGGISDAASTITGGRLLVKDVTTFATLQTDNDDKYVTDDADVSTEVGNKNEYDLAEGENTITEIILNGGEWNVASTPTGTKEIGVPTKDIALKNATLNFESGVTVTTWTSKTVTATSGTCAISADAAVTLKINVAVEAGATLNVNENITVNASSNYTGYSSNVAGTLNVNAGAAAYFATAEVEKGGVINVYGETDDAIAAVFGVADDGFENNGTVNGVAPTKTGGTGSKAKITVPTSGEGSFTGSFGGSPSMS